ncbi:MAG TPA: hypothetical protein VMH84_18130 [Xanthobacteraceae bacterium]|nr:hypothetical protein [Xanthobacteraceae bacterium]
MKFHEIRRLDDGPIDFAFYREQAISLRRQAIREVMGRVGRKSPFKVLATLGSLVALLFSTSSPDRFA